MWFLIASSNQKSDLAYRNIIQGDSFDQVVKQIQKEFAKIGLRTKERPSFEYDRKRRNVSDKCWLEIGEGEEIPSRNPLFTMPFVDRDRDVPTMFIERIEESSSVEDLIAEFVQQNDLQRNNRR